MLATLNNFDRKGYKYEYKNLMINDELLKDYEIVVKYPNYKPDVKKTGQVISLLLRKLKVK
jgi:hypothetical protein